MKQRAEFLKGASNVYRTRHFIVRQRLGLLYNDEESNQLISRDTYYSRTPERDPNNNANRGLPTSERPIGLCVMPKGEKSRNGDVREMTLNIRHGNGVPIVVRGR